MGYAIEFWSLKALISLRLDMMTLSKILFCGMAMGVMVYEAQQVWYSIELLGVYVVIGTVLYSGLVRQMRVLRKRDFDVTRELVGSRFKSVVDIAEKLARP